MKMTHRCALNAMKLVILNVKTDVVLVYVGNVILVMIAVRK